MNFSRNLPVYDGLRKLQREAFNERYMRQLTVLFEEYFIIPLTAVNHEKSEVHYRRSNVAQTRTELWNFGDL